MNNFKLIAVIPLPGCSKKYCKNLTTGYPYQFYNEYKIELSRTGQSTEIERVETNPTVPENLYELNNGIQLNISAVVGKNGTGKSSIIELFFYLVYVVYTQKEINGRRILNTEFEEIEKKHKDASNDYAHLNTLIKGIDEEISDDEKNAQLNHALAIALDLITKYRLLLSEEDKKDPETIIRKVKAKINDTVILNLFVKKQDQQAAENHLKENLAVSILFESDNIVREISYSSKKFSYATYQPDRKEVSSEIKDFKLEDFFYTICINYSHHGLNSKSLGNWINKLFHKNDAYFTPVVINPMREEGNFNINHELKLSKERLMANILHDLAQTKSTKLLNKYNIAEFIFTPKRKGAISQIPLGSNISHLLSRELLQSRGIEAVEDSIDYWRFAINYLEDKIGRIEDTYSFLIYEENPQSSDWKQLNNFLKTDRSHVTKKVRQTLNFLEITCKVENRQFWQMPKNNLRISLTPEKMLDWLDLFQIDLAAKTPSELIEYGLPGFFSIDLLLEDESNGTTIEFSRLSSGEQQLILNSNAILYHLYNINSIHANEGQIQGNEPKRIAYKNINIILDEVELYYHPEMQRRLVSELIDNFQKIKRKEQEGIKAINVCILTHSPFILSDVPSQNVLSLAEKDSEDLLSLTTQTFGGNIEEMLMGKFFMESTTGEYVRRLIRELLAFYNKVREAVSDEEIFALEKEYSDKSFKFRFIQKNIGEDVIRNVLGNHLDFIDAKLYAEI